MILSRNDPYYTDRLATVVGPIVPVVLWVNAGMQLILSIGYWLHLMPVDDRNVAMILTVAALSISLLGWGIRSAVRHANVALAGICSVLAVTILSIALSIAPYLTDLSATYAMAFCVLVAISAAPFWLHTSHHVAGLVGCFVPPYIVAFATDPSLREWSFCIQITLVSLVMSVGIFLLMRRTSLRAYQMSVELAHRASYDGLTGALNRATWVERARARLEQDQKRGRSTACLFVDMDEFKEINDVQGHEAGDTLLGNVADVLRLFGDGDRLVGRIGGDEFVLLLPETGGDEAREIAERVHLALCAIVRDQGDARPVASIGVSASEPLDSLADLVKRADLSMLDEKGTHRKREIASWSAPLTSAQVFPFAG